MAVEVEVAEKRKRGCPTASGHRHSSVGQLRGQPDWEKRDQCLGKTFKKIIYLFGCTRSYLQHVGASTLTRIKPRPPALEVLSLSHWTTREVPWARLSTTLTYTLS